MKSIPLSNRVRKSAPDLVVGFNPGDLVGTAGAVVFLSPGTAGSPLIVVGDLATCQVSALFTPWNAIKALGRLGLLNPFLGPGPADDVFGSVERGFLCSIWSAKWLASRIGAVFSTSPSLEGSQASDPFFPARGRLSSLAACVDLTLQTAGYDLGAGSGSVAVSAALENSPPAYVAGFTEGRPAFI